MTSYQNSEITHEDDLQYNAANKEEGCNSSRRFIEEKLSATRTTSSTKRSIVIPLVAISLALFGLLAFENSVRDSSSGENKIDLLMDESFPLEGSPQTRACTFFECLNSGCNPIGAAFTCLFHSGGPHGGCSLTIWTPETCSESCDLSGCADLPILDSLESCEASKCSQEWCQQGQIVEKASSISVPKALGALDARMINTIGYCMDALVVMSTAATTSKQEVPYWISLRESIRYFLLTRRRS